MPYQQYLSYTGTGTMASIGLDPSIAPFQASAGMGISGTATYYFQYSLDPLTVADANSTWFNDANLGPNQNTAGTTNYAFPITKVRTVIVSINGTASIKVLQGFTSN